MIRNPNDELVELVFGELDEAQAERVRARLERDPAARAVVASYRQMREDLGKLREVPEDQLSSERLRHAILTKGLEREPERPTLWSWIWMPGMAACLAFGFFALRNRGFLAEAPNLVLSEKTIAQGAPPVDLNPKASAPESAKTLAMTPEKGTPAVVARTTVRGGSSRHGMRLDRRRKTDPNEGLVAMRIPTGEPFAEGEAVMDSLRNSAPQVPVETAPAPAQPSEIVLIGEEKNADTGTNTATEVASYSNVVVGG